MDHGRERAVLVADDRERRIGGGRREVGFDGGDQNRNRCGLEHLLRLGAQHEAADAATPVRGHEDEVAAARFRRAEDRLVRTIARGRERAVPHAGGTRDDLRLGEQRARFARHRVVERAGAITRSRAPRLVAP